MMKRNIHCKKLPGVVFFLILVLSAAAEEKSPLFVDLKEFPIYVKTGFSLEDTQLLPDAASGEWKVVSPADSKGKALSVRRLNLPGIPRRVFLSLRGTPEREFTYVIPFTMKEAAIELLVNNSALIPGMNFGAIGDNWEVYLNGSLIKSEMYLDGSGRIKIHRNVHSSYFPVDRTLFKSGVNILALRIVGDPTYNDTGMFYAIPYQVDDYASILRNNNETITLILLGVYLFLGIYHLFMYAVRRKDTYNFYYGLFSVILGIYFLSRSDAINYFFPDRSLIVRAQFFCAFIVIPLGTMFLEQLCLKRISLITRIYGAFLAFLALVQCFSSLAFSYDTLTMWMYTILAVVPYILVYDIGYLFVVSAREIRNRYGQDLSRRECFRRTVTETPIGNLLVGVIICLGTGVFDVLDSLVFHYGLNLTRYGFFVFTAGTTLILARRFAALFSQQQRIIVRSNKGMNVRLVDWIAVQDKDPYDMPSIDAKNAIMFTDIRSFTSLSEGMLPRTLTSFLSAVNEILAGPLFDAEDKGSVAYTDKLIGDGIMNIFTDPETALKTAIHIRKQLQLFNDNPRAFFPEASENMKINVGTGLAYGPVTFGIMGHSRRIDYTPIGDTVNLASRLETLTKEYHASIIINDQLYGALPDKSPFNLRHIDRIRVKGKSIPVDIYEEFSANSPVVRDLKHAFRSRFAELQDMYFSGNEWDSAIRLAKNLMAHYKKVAVQYNIDPESPPDHLPGIYLKRMKTIRANPGLMERWDGVYTFTQK